MQAGVARGEERRLPAEEPLAGEGCVVVLGGVEHHRNHALGPPIGRANAGQMHPEPTRDRGANALTVEALSLDFRASHGFIRERFELRLQLQVEAEAAHGTEEAALPQASISEWLQEPGVVPREVGPFRPLPDEHSGFLLAS